MDEIASVWINSRLDLSGVVRDLKSLDNSNYTLKVSVDDDALTKLNKHLDLKVKHFREVNQVFKREKIKVLVDNTELSKIDKISNKKKIVNVDIKYNYPIINPISNLTQTIDVDTSRVEKKLNDVQKSISKQSSSSFFGNLLLAPLKLAANSIGTVLEGIVHGVTAPIGEDIGRGIKEGIQKESSQIIGSFEFVSKKIAENLSGAIVDALEGDADKIRDVLQIVGNYNSTDLAIENRRNVSGINKKEQQRRNAGIDAVQEARENIAANRPQFEARKVSIVDKRQELVKNYQKIEAAMNRSMEKMGASEMQKRIETLKTELTKNLQQLSSPTDSTNFDEISTASKEIGKEISQLTDKLGGIAELVKARYEDFIGVLDDELKNISSEERRLINDLAPLNEAENLQKLGIKSSNKLRKQVKTTQPNVPEIYQQVFEQVTKASGTTGNAKIPNLVVNPNLSAATLGKYNPEQNQIQVTEDAYQQILSGDVTKVSEKFFEILVHELRHAAQFDFGEIDAFNERSNIELVKPTASEIANLGGRIELSTSTTQGVSPRRVRELETDAYVFAERNAEQIRNKVVASQFQQNMGVGAGKIQNLLKIESAQSISTFKKTKMLAEGYSVDITNDINESRQKINEIIRSIDPLLEKAANVEILPVSEINSLNDELMLSYQNAVFQIQQQVNKVKQNTLQKISDARNIPELPSQEEFKNTLNEEYTSQGLRQVVKRLGVSNNSNRKKQDLIEIIAQSNNKQVESILTSLGDSIKRVNYRSSSVINNQIKSISLDSFKDANKQIQNKLKELKIVSEVERKQIVESLVIDLNKQINEIEKINETSNLSGKQSQQLGGFKSYFEKLRQPLANEFSSNNPNKSLNLPISQLNNQGELSGVGDVEEFINNLIKNATRKENTDDTIKEIIENFEELAAKFNLSEEKFNELEKAINDRYEELTNGTAEVKKIGKAARQRAMNSPDIQNDPEARFYANSVNFQRSEEKFERAESSINSRYFAALGGNPIPPNIPPLINNISNAVANMGDAFNNIPLPIKNAVAAFSGFFVLSNLIPLFQNFAKESASVATQMEALEQRLTFATGSKSIGQGQIQQLRSQAEYLGLNQKEVLSSGASFLSTSKGTPIEGQESVKGLMALNQATRVYNLTTEQSGRAQVALQQVVGKGVVQQEELRGQLSEAIPGAAQIAARAYGVTTQELNRMVTSGLDSVEFFRKFTQQLGIETSGGVAGALNTTQAAMSRFDANMLKLQETFGKMLLPIQNMGLNVLSTGLNAITASLPVITALFAALTAKVTIFATQTLVEMIGKLIASQVAMGSLGATARVVGSTISLAFREFLGFAIIGAGIANLINQFRDLSGELRSQITAVKSLQSEYQTLTNVGFKIKQPEVNDFEILKRKIPLVIRGMVTGEVKAVQDSLKAIKDSAGISDEVLTTTVSSETIQSINQLKEIESQLESLQIKKRALAQTDPGNKEGQRLLNNQERKLLDARTEATKIPDNVRKQLHSQAEAVKAQLEYLQKLKKEFPLYGEDVKKVNERIETLTSDYDKLLSAQEKLVKSIGEGADAFALMQRNIKFVSDSLSDLNDKNQIAANLLKERLTNSVVNGGLSPQQEAARNQQLEIELRREQAKSQLSAIKQQQALLNTPQNLQRMQAFGVNENTGRARLATLTEQTTNVQDKFLFEQLGNLQSQKLELSNLRLQVAQAQKEAQQQMVDLTKQVADYYRTIERQAQEQSIEIKKLELQSRNQQAQNRLKSIFTDGYDTIVGTLVDGIESAMNQLSSSTDKALDAQSQLLQSKFGVADARRSGIELQRSIPNLPTIKVDLDFSSIPDDNNVTKLRDDVDETIGGTQNLSSSILETASNAEELSKQLLTNLPPITEAERQTELVRANLEKSNLQSERASQLGNQWTASISPIPTQIDLVNQGLSGVLSTMGNLLTQTTSWIGQLVNAPNLLGQIGQGINTFFGANSTGSVSSGGSGFVSPIKGKTLDELINYKPSRGQGFFGQRSGGRQHSKVDFDSRIGGGQGAEILSSISGIATARMITPISAGVNIEGKDSKGNNITVVYNHLASPEIIKRFNAGGKGFTPQQVKAGERLSTVTMDSLSSGAHLDFGIKVNGKYVEPQKWLATEGKALAAIQTQVNNQTTNTNSSINTTSNGGVLWGKASNYAGSDLSGLTARGKKAMEALKNPRVRATLDAIAIAELGEDAAAKGGYGYLFGDTGGKESFNPNQLGTHPKKRVSKWGHTSSATGRYQTMDFVWNEEAGRLGIKDFKPQSQEIMAVSRLMYRGVLEQIMKGDVAGAIAKPGNFDLSSEWASLQGNPYGQGTSGGKRSNFLANVNKFGNQAIPQQVQTLANNFRAAPTQQLSQTIQYGTSTAVSSIEQRSAEQQRLSKLQQEADNIAAKTIIARTKRQIERANREAQDANISERRSVTDLQYEGVAFPTTQQQNVKQSTDNLRKHEDTIKGYKRRLEEVNAVIKQSDDAIKVYNERIKEGGLTTDELNAQKEGLKLVIDTRKKNIINKNNIQSNIKATEAAFKKQEAARVERASFEENIRYSKEQIADQRSLNSLLQQRISNIEQIKQISPTDPRVAMLPELREELAINNLGIETYERKIDAEEQLKRNGITSAEYQRRMTILNDENNSKLQGIRLTRQQEDAEAALVTNRRQLEISGKSLEIQSQLGEGKVKDLERDTRLGLFGENTYELEKARTEQVNNQILTNNNELRKKIIEIKEFGRETGQSTEEVNKLIDSLHNVNNIEFDRLRTELRETIAADKLAAIKQQLEISSKYGELSNQIGEGDIKRIERDTRLNPFSIDTGELAKARTEQVNNQRILNDINLKKQIIDIQEFGKQNSLSEERVSDLIRSLQSLNELQLDNLKIELSDALDADALAESQKVRENLATQFSLNRQPILDLTNAKADRYEQTGGNPFVANATRRETAREAELQQRSQALMQLDEQVLQARQRGIEVTDSRVAELRNNIVEMSEIKLDGLNNQFKNIATTLGDIAKQGMSQLSQGLADVITKGGSLGDVFDNLFGTVLNQALNMGISSLFGGLFGGMFASGGIAGARTRHENDLVGAIAGAAQSEKALSGRKPVLIMAHEGELMIPASRVKELTQMGLGAGMLLGENKVKNYAYGGFVGESMGDKSKEYGSTMGTRNAASTLQIEYKSREIAGEKYVTETDFQQGLMVAVEEGSRRGASIVTNKLTNSPSYRRSLGL